MSASQQQWFLLTSSDPKVAEEQLHIENRRREDTQHLREPLRQNVLEYFIPYQFLKRHQTGDQPHTRTKDAADAYHSNQIRAALHRYVFVRALKRDLERTLRQPWNVSEHRLQFFHDKQGRQVSVSHDEMGKFMQACADERLKFEVWPAIDDIEELQEVQLLSTPFRGQRVKVLEKRHTRNGTRFTIEVKLFNGTFSAKFYDLKDEDVQYDHDSERRQVSRDSKLVTRFQRDLIGILSRRIHQKETDQSRRDDVVTLDNIYNFRALQLQSIPLRRRCLAMMLICAQLRHDKVGRQTLCAAVESELQQMARQSESRAATDVRAYLHVALYLATGQPQYRDAAKAYVRQHSPKSEDLRRLVTLASRREASRIFR